MSRKAPDTKPETTRETNAPHPLPQSGGSFTVTAGQLVLEEYARNAASAPEQTPDEPAVKSNVKEA
ncbi:hypothetical protein EGN72_02455 [Pseudorhodobacter sp. E13]|uniref:hypothetical protein n=1 Tax=Pseudorhodobacter sp. E13 TaxID=2487931 RepID=UPI000F8F593A|nr:hypothetical protein [Pseudorhodobacter sp. E13]RUS64872.1 hypothetical protein EGN72_02455 [Pseudorhodobacter sp. E13]